MSLYISEDGRFHVQHRFPERFDQFSKARFMKIAMQVQETLTDITEQFMEMQN